MKKKSERKLKKKESNKLKRNQKCEIKFWKKMRKIKKSNKSKRPIKI